MLFSLITQSCWNDSNTSNILITHLVFCCTGTRFNPCDKNNIKLLSPSVSALEVGTFRNVEQAAAIVCDDSLITDSISESVFFLFLISEVGTTNEQSLTWLPIFSLSEIF